MGLGTVALAAFVGSLIALSSGCANPSSDDPPSPGIAQSTAADGDHVSYYGYGGKAVVSADGRTIAIGLYPGNACPAKITPVARQTATQVALYLAYDTPPNPPPCLPVNSPPVQWHDIQLARPLGDRSLVDGATGKAIAWISARLVLRPTVLPPGYRFNRLIPYGENTFSGPAGCLQYYLSGISELVIGQSVGSTNLESAPGHWTHIRVRGYPGLATRNVIAWRENGLNDYIMAIVAALSTQQLITIANSAQTYNLAPLPNPGR